MKGDWPLKDDTKSNNLQIGMKLSLDGRITCPTLSPVLEKEMRSKSQKNELSMVSIDVGGYGWRTRHL